MIPTLGLMIGCYIATKMLALLIPEKDGKQDKRVKIAAGITIAIAFLVVVSLFKTGFNISEIANL